MTRGATRFRSDTSSAIWGAFQMYTPKPRILGWRARIVSAISSVLAERSNSRISARSWSSFKLAKR